MEKNNASTNPQSNNFPGQSIAKRLREIKDLPGSGERAHALFTELLETHKNRPAMREEFSNTFPGWEG